MMPTPPHKKTVLTGALSDFIKAGEHDNLSENPEAYVCSPEDWALSHKIMDRIMELAHANGHHGIHRETMHQSLMLAHCARYPLKLLQLLMSNNDDFTHDVLGIAMHMDAKTGILKQDFKPRFLRDKT